MALPPPVAAGGTIVARVVTHLETDSVFSGLLAGGVWPKVAPNVGETLDKAPRPFAYVREIAQAPASYAGPVQVTVGIETHNIQGNGAASIKKAIERAQWLLDGTEWEPKPFSTTDLRIPVRSFWFSTSDLVPIREWGTIRYLMMVRLACM